MPIDPSIPLAVANPLELQQIVYKNQLAQMQMQQAQQAQQQNNALLGILKQPGAMGDNGMPTQATVGRIMQANPEAGFRIQNQLAQIEENKQRAITNSINQRLIGMNIGAKEHDTLVDIATSAQQRYDDLVANGTPKDEAARIAGQERNKAVADAQSSGLLNPSQANQLQMPFNPETNRAFITGSPQYKRILDEQRQARMEKNQERRLDITEANNERRLNLEERRESRLDAAFNNRVNDPGAGITDDAIDLAAQQYLQTGQMPPLGMGASGVALRTKIIDRAAEISRSEGVKAADVPANRASFKSDSTSLTTLTKQSDAINAFEKTAIRNGDRLMTLADKVDKTGVPMLERWIRGGRKATGDADVAAFNAQMQVYRTEAAKILTNPNLSGQLTDAARKEVEDFIGGNSSASQIRSVVQLLKNDFEQRKATIGEQISEIKNRMRGKDSNGNGGANDTKQVNVNGRMVTARKARDGNYYVQKPGGGWAKVVE
jgi:hypothetical protein